MNVWVWALAMVGVTVILFILANLIALIGGRQIRRPAWVFLCLFLVISLADGFLSYNGKTRREREAVESRAWQKQMTEAGCKRTSYVATCSTVHSIWTCPDGTAYRE